MIYYENDSDANKKTFRCDKDLIFIALLLPVAMSCGGNSGNENTRQKSEALAFRDVKYDPRIGEEHNRIVMEILKSGVISEKNSYETNKADVYAYVREHYNMDVSAIVEDVITNPGEAIIDKYKDNYSSTFASTVKAVFRETETVGEDKEKVITIIKSYFTKAQEREFELSEGENNALMNMLTVFAYSCDLWYPSTPSGFANGFLWPSPSWPNPRFDEIMAIIRQDFTGILNSAAEMALALQLAAAVISFETGAATAAVASGILAALSPAQVAACLVIIGGCASLNAYSSAISDNTSTLYKGWYPFALTNPFQN